MVRPKIESCMHDLVRMHCLVDGVGTRADPQCVRATACSDGRGLLRQPQRQVHREELPVH